MYKICSTTPLLLVITFVVLTFFVKEGLAVLCWECNSAHDPRCGEHHFDNHTLGVIDCNQLEKPHLKSIKPKFCRKIIQRIGDDTRVIRGCGWLDDKKAHHRCYKRTGTKDVQVIFCQCEGDRCNSGSTFNMALVSLLAPPLLIFTTTYARLF